MPPGGHLHIGLDDLDNLGINEIYVRRGALPTPGSYDYRFSVAGADQTIFVPNAAAGDWFILAYNDSGPLPGQFTLEVDFIEGVVLQAVSPETIGNTGLGSITIDGAGFDTSTQVSLASDGTFYAATNVSFVSASRIVAEFDFAIVPPNAYQLTVVQGGRTETLPLTVTEGIGANFEANLVVPSQVGRNTVASLYIQYANTGDTAMQAPLLVLTGSQNSKLTIKPGLVVQDFYTCGQPADANNIVQILASGQTPGVLQPGESVRVPVHYLGLENGGDLGNDVVQFALGRATVPTPGGPPEPAIDWASLKSQMSPPSIPADAWDALWQNFTAAAGNTWSSYQQMLRENASYLSRLGVGNFFSPSKALQSLIPLVAPSHVGDMLAFAFGQADGLHIVRFIAASTDGFTPTPGLRLSLERVSEPHHRTLPPRRFWPGMVAQLGDPLGACHRWHHHHRRSRWRPTHLQARLPRRFL